MGTQESCTAGPDREPASAQGSCDHGVGQGEDGNRKRRRQVCIGLAFAFGVVGPASANDVRTAAIVLAMSAFVGHHCPHLRPNDLAIHDVFKKSGFDTPDPPPLLMSEAGSIQAGLKRMPIERACSQLWEHFGVFGSSQPGLLEATGEEP